MKKILSALILVFSIFHFPFSVKPQVRPVYDLGAGGLGQMLKRLPTVKSAMMIGAHPDDEDSGLLAYLARGENARTAYLSLTRGDGGQNLIGEELFESLGVIRTEELLQARRLDGAEQFFTRAFDYGFSKTLAEARQKWDERVILCDAVRAIREFRPQVVISRFSGTPADGHGQHQYAGYIAPLAVKAAADAEQCKDAGPVWEVKKFYVSQGFRSTGEPGLRVNTGRFDPLIGRSYFEIAMEGRSQHKTQEQGVLELKGDRFSGLNLIDSKVPRAEKETGIFDGIDTNLTGLLASADQSAEADLLDYLRDWQINLENRLKEIPLLDGRAAIPVLLDGLKKADDLTEKFEAFRQDPHSRELLEIKRREFLQAVRLASGLQIDALAARETVVPGETLQTSVKIYYPENVNYRIKDVELIAPEGFEVGKTGPPAEQGQSFFGREMPDEAAYFSVNVAETAAPTQPFWLARPRDGDVFSAPPAENQTLPFQKPFLTAAVTAEIDGVEMRFYQPVEYRYADDVRGELRRDLNIVPKLSLAFEKDLVLVTDAAKPQERELYLRITNNSETAVSGAASLELPAGWSALPPTKEFALGKKGETVTIRFTVKVPADFKRGRYLIKARAESGGAVFAQTMHTIAYPHIQTHRFYTDAKIAFNVLDLKVAPVSVGYIMGSGDRVPQAIEQMGLSVTMLDENYLSAGDLSKFDVIVVGVRASQTRPDFVANNKRLIEFMTAGGTLIVQYQQFEYARQDLAPYPVKMDSSVRTTDERAPVKILAPAHQVFNFPNKITERDFDDWVQERNLYTFTSFDERYVPLLETHDAGEPESLGGMLYAEVGRGRYVYTAYSFFRQLPAGNAGAFRLFANLLSLPKAAR